jgi:hypothetical protein
VVTLAIDNHAASLPIACQLYPPEVERGLEGGVVDRAHGAQQRVSEITAQYGADLRDIARFAERVEPRRERLLKRRRDRLQAARLAALEQKARDLLDEQRHATRALADGRLRVSAGAGERGRTRCSGALRVQQALGDTTRIVPAT